MKPLYRHYKRCSAINERIRDFSSARLLPLVDQDGSSKDGVEIGEIISGKSVEELAHFFSLKCWRNLDLHVEIGCKDEALTRSSDKAWTKSSDKAWTKSSRQSSLGERLPERKHFLAQIWNWREILLICTIFGHSNTWKREIGGAHMSSRNSQRVLCAEKLHLVKTWSNRDYKWRMASLMLAATWNLSWKNKTQWD